MKKNEEIKLSIVIITRNEEFNIEQCIQSAIKDAQNMTFEIVIIDATSTDNTIKLASTYPVKIIQTPYDKFKSPSAARFIGTKYTKGEFILFLDADVRIIPGWIKKAISYFSEKKLAGVRGRLFNVYPGEKVNKNHGENHKLGYRKPLGGQASMYKRVALEDCGTFHPFLKGEEERELYYRLTSNGWKLRVVDVPMAYHFNKTKNVSEIDEKAGYYTGVGQIINKYPSKKISKELIFSQKRMLIELFGIILLIISLIVMGILKNLIIVYTIVILIILALLITSFFKSPYKTYLYMRSRILTGKNIFIGLIKGLDDPDTFMDKITLKVIKK